MLRSTVREISACPDFPEDNGTITRVRLPLSLRKRLDDLALGSWKDRAEKAEAEVERLRALCASRPPWPIGCSPEFHAWMDTIDAAGRGEGLSDWDFDEQHGGSE
jgi:hypothetical protein